MSGECSDQRHNRSSPLFPKVHFTQLNEWGAKTPKAGPREKNKQVEIWEDSNQPNVQPHL